MTDRATARIFDALDRFRLELPSWGFANTGTRFGVFHQPAAASTTAEKLADAGFVHALTGVCPTVALHVQWDLPGGRDDVDERRSDRRQQAGIRPGAINPNFFQDQAYKHGSFGNPDPAIRAQARAHGLDEHRIAAPSRAAATSRAGSPTARTIPGPRSSAQRKRWFEEELRALHARARPASSGCSSNTSRSSRRSTTPTSPTGAWRCCSRAPRVRARGCSSTPATTTSRRTSNRSSRGCWPSSMLGGFHFNDRRYADDDLTTGSIDPYQVFRIFHEIRFFEWETGAGRHRLRDRSEPQPQGQDRGDDSDRRHGAGAVRQGGARRSRSTGGRAARQPAGAGRVVPAGCLRDRRAAVDRRVAHGRRAFPPIRSMRCGRAATSSGSRTERDRRADAVTRRLDALGPPCDSRERLKMTPT